jgi:hypothetical protein
MRSDLHVHTRRSGICTWLCTWFCTLVESVFARWWMSRRRPVRAPRVANVAARPMAEAA